MLARSSVVCLSVSFLLVVLSGAVPIVLQEPPDAARVSRIARRQAPSVSGDDFTRILSRNQAMGALAASGLVTGGVTTVTTLSGMGFTTAQAAMHAQSRLRLPIAHLTALILPHAIVELTGFVAAGAAGLLGLPLLIAAAEGDRRRALFVLRRSVGLFGAAVVIITMAAAVEVVITPRIAEWVMAP
jgi:uncharacterized membrane protein SpoIIM required for sporulation